MLMALYLQVGCPGLGLPTHWKAPLLPCHVGGQDINITSKVGKCSSDVLGNHMVQSDAQPALLVGSWAQPPLGPHLGGLFSLFCSLWA